MMAPFDQQAVIDSFSRAARTYDQHAEFQRIAGNKLLETLENVLTHSPLSIENCNITDLGCGTGFFTRQLFEKFPNATVSGVDIARGMIDVCQSASIGEAYYQADVCELPFADNSQHVIFSNLTFQWIENLPKLFTELERVRADSGIIVFSTLGEKTLFELKSAWRSVDDNEHINQFVSSKELNAMCSQKWSSFELSDEEVVMPYLSVMDIMRDLKGIGAQNRGNNRTRGLMRPSAIKQLEHAYKAHESEQGSLPVTYQLLQAIIS